MSCKLTVLSGSIQDFQRWLKVLEDDMFDLSFGTFYCGILTGREGEDEIQVLDQALINILGDLWLGFEFIDDELGLGRFERVLSLAKEKNLADETHVYFENISEALSNKNIQEQLNCSFCTVAPTLKNLQRALRKWQAVPEKQKQLIGVPKNLSELLYLIEKDLFDEQKATQVFLGKKPNYLDATRIICPNTLSMGSTSHPIEILMGEAVGPILLRRKNDFNILKKVVERALDQAFSGYSRPKCYQVIIDVGSTSLIQASLLQRLQESIKTTLNLSDRVLFLTQSKWRSWSFFESQKIKVRVFVLI